MTIRVVVADDQTLVRAGFRLILDSRDDLEVVGEAADGATAVDVVAELVPDVVLMDVRMPVLDGIEATKRIVTTGLPTRIIILTTYDLDEYVYAALAAGASGFMLKDVRPAELAEGVRVVARGDALLAATVTRRCSTGSPRRSPTRGQRRPTGPRPRPSRSSPNARPRFSATSPPPARTARSPTCSACPKPR